MTGCAQRPAYGLPRSAKSLQRPARASPLPGSRAAFSLVELLVVLGIIVILIAMLLPALRRARGDAVRVQCANNLRQIGMGLEIYDQTHKRLHGGDTLMFFIALDRAGETVIDPPPAAGETGAAEAVLSISPGTADLRGALLENRSCAPETFLCGRHELYGNAEGASSYAMNRNYTASKMSKGKGDIILAYESAGILAGGAGPGDATPTLDTGPDAPAPLPPPGGPAAHPDAAYRHGLLGNWLFFDGHVDLLSDRDAAGPNGEGWGTRPH